MLDCWETWLGFTVTRRARASLPRQSHCSSHSKKVARRGPPQASILPAYRSASRYPKSSTAGSRTPVHSGKSAIVGGAVASEDPSLSPQVERVVPENWTVLPGDERPSRTHPSGDPHCQTTPIRRNSSARGRSPARTG